MNIVIEEDSNEGCKESVESESSVSPTSNLHAFHFQDQQARNERLLTMRKVKSRNAARTRRGKENFEFYELAKLLPIPTETSSQLDKASIIRLTMSYLKMREFAYCGSPSWNVTIEGPPPNRTVKDTSRSKIVSSFSPLMVSNIFECQLGSHLLQSLDSFIFALNCQARFIYVSETITRYLGLSQVEMIGSSIFDYTHPADQSELAIQLGLTLSSQNTTENSRENSKGVTSGQDNKKFTRSFFIRMKSTLTKRGVNLKSSSYKVVHMCTRARIPCAKRLQMKKTILSQEVKSTSDVNGKGNKLQPECPLGLSGVGAALAPPTSNDVHLDKPIFVTRLNPAFKFTYCDTMISNLLGYDVHEVVGRNLYHSIHAGDIEKLKLCHAEVLNKGQMMTPYYRWLHKSGGYVWVYSCVTMLTNQRLYPEQSFIWVNYAISEQMEQDRILDVLQMSAEELQHRQTLNTKQDKTNGKNLCKSRLKSEKNIATLSSKPEVPPCDKRKSVEPVHLNVSLSPISAEVKKALGNIVIKINSKRSKEATKCATVDVNNNTKNDDAERNLAQADKQRNSVDVIDISYKPNKVANGICQKSILHPGKHKEVNDDWSDPENFVADNEVTESTVTSSGEKNKINNLTTTSKLNTRKRVRHSRKKFSHFKCKKVTRHAEEAETTTVSKKDAKLLSCDTEMHKSSVVDPSVSLKSGSAVTSVNSTESISDYMDADSVVWSNPPNKEISNHNDLPPGIKQMHGLWAVRRTTPSAVHHHYPFGINPTLLHSNPVLAKIMMAGWGGYPQPFRTNEAYLMATPVQFMSPVHISQFNNNCSYGDADPAELSQEAHTPASVAAVLEELKKDPMHKVNPPNKVVIPNIPGSESTIISGNKHLLHSLPSFSALPSSCNQERNILNTKSISSISIIEPPCSQQNIDPTFVKLPDENRSTETMLQIPHTLLAVNNMPTNNLLFNGPHPSLLAVTPDAMLNLPINSSTFSQPRSSYVIQPFTIPQV